MREHILSATSSLKIFFRDFSISPNNLLIISAAVFIFIIDLQLPLGVAAGVPYALVIFASLWANGIFLTYWVSGLSLVFVILGYFLSPPSVVPIEIILINRGLTLLLIVSTAIMAIKIKKANIDISALSSNVLIDSISGLKNKQAFDIELHTETLRCQRYQRNLSIALIDIDLSHFTREKDNHSQVHEIIRNIANNIKSKIRTSDLLYHTDTQQFAILFPETELSEAKDVCEIIRNKTSFSATQHNENKLFVACIGIATLEPHDNSINLFQRAEDALSLSKDSVKHQVSTVPEINGNKDKNVIPAILSRSRSD
ncbi:MAG: diguanylate cyclase [Nitrosomonas sp.]